MIETQNLHLQKYELNDAANLADGYNNSMDTLDTVINTLENNFPVENLAPNSVKTTNIENEAVTNEKLAAESVTADKIADGEIVDRLIGENELTLDKFNENDFDNTPTEGSNKLVKSGGIVLGIKEAINNAKKSVIVIGDSFSTVANNWVGKAFDPLNVTAYNFAEGGAGFVNKGSSGTAHTFLEQLQIAKNTLTTNQISDVRCIIIYGGINDLTTNRSETEVNAAISALNTYITQNFPYIPVYVCTCNVGVPTTSAYNRFLAWLTPIQEFIETQSNLILVRSTPFWLFGYSTSIFSDGTHPANTGSQLIAKMMQRVWFGDTIPVVYGSKHIDVNIGSEQVAHINIWLSWCNDNVQMWGPITGNFAPNYTTIIEDFPMTFGNIVKSWMIANYAGDIQSGSLQLYNNLLRYAGGQSSHTNVSGNVFC